MKPIRISIDVTKLDKSLFVTGKKGVYVDLVAWPLKTPDDRSTHYVKQSLKRDEKRELPIVGNLCLPIEDAPPAPAPQQDQGEDDEVPF